jgi:tetratricopeptide (TPR) repeat protein
MRTARARSLGLAMAIVLGVLPAGADPISEMDDAAARMQYAFYTADVRGIEDALGQLQRLELPESRRTMRDYYIAYGHWKLAQLYAGDAATGRRDARANGLRAASACEKAAAEATKQDPRLAEAYAIQASCAALGSRAPEVLSLGNCARHKSLLKARELSPTNPRIRLLEAQCVAKDEARAAALLPQVEQIVKDFDTAPSARVGEPDWGQAEALLLLGRLQLDAGNRLAARDSLERALIIAPEYRDAQELLARATSAR